MEVGQITMEPTVARKHYLAYRGLLEKQRTTTDDEIQQSYLELSRGHAILNAKVALETAGRDERGRPRIAFARADWRSVECQSWRWRNVVQFLSTRGYGYPVRNTRLGSLLEIPITEHFEGRVQALVPDIPPAHRPAGDLSRYWICWEVEDWDEVPVDPLLLKRLNANTFSVLAAWDLTEVERMVLAGRST